MPVLAVAVAARVALAPAGAATPAEPSIPVGSFVHITDDEGLAHSDVRAITQDQEGFIWFGLRLGGLTRYDGYELKVYEHEPANPGSIGNRIIWSLLVDRHGTLWVGTEGGLERFDRATESFVHYRADATRTDGLANNVVTCLFEDAAGKIWAGTREGLCRLDDPERGVFTTFRRPQVIPGSTTKDTFRSIIEDPTTGLLWLGATDGMVAFDPRTGAFASYLHDPEDSASLTRNAVNKVLRDEQGTFWALTEHGLNSFRPGFSRIAEHAVQQPRLEFRRFLQPGGDANPAINFVRDGLVDRSGRLWLATRGGVCLFDRATDTLTAFRRNPADPASLSDDLTQAIFEDRAGNLWIATYAGGVNRLRSEAKPFRTHRHVPGDTRSLSEDRVTGLTFDAAGRLWVTTPNGLNRRDVSGWTRILHEPAEPHSLPSNDLSTVAVAPNGDVWLGSMYSGAYRFDHERFHTFPTAPAHATTPNGLYPFTGWQVNSLLGDPRGGMWLGTRASGLDYHADGRFRHFNPQETPLQPTTNAVLGVLTAEGELWYATELQGLVRLEIGSQRFTAFAPPSGRAGATRSLHCIADGGDGTIWIGAADGLLRFDVPTETFVRDYTTSDGLPHNAVMTLVRDRRGHLWIGTANGLADFNPATGRFRNYEKPDGLPSSVFSQRAGVLGPEGRVYLGTRAGLVEFAPETLRDNPVPPPVVVTELRWIGEAPVGVRGRRDVSVLSVGDTIHVSAGQPGFSLKFSALDFSAPEKNRFRYRLEGWDANWSEATARERSATYTALPPGSYTFRVQGSNVDQVWNEVGASVRIIVAPHFWETTWFRLGVAAAVLGGLLAGLRWRTSAIRRQNVRLEQLVSQRTAQLQEEVAVREQAEAALRESHTELERRVQARTAELAHTNASLQTEINERRSIEAQLRQSQKMEVIGQLAGGVAHDFNNLLTVVLGQSALLSEGSLSLAERDAAVRDIKEAAQRATNLTRQLLILSRHQVLTPVAVDLNQIVQGLGKLLRHVIGEHLEFQTRLAPASLGVLADPGMLEQVLLNLAVNARDAMPRGGRLTISTDLVTAAPSRTRARGPFARVSVSDTGVGIPPDILPQIFEPFFTTKEPGKGTGLGLAISQGIAQKHGGWIEVETAPDRGTTFHVLLPGQPLPEATAAPASVPRQSPEDAATILVAEDEKAVRSLVCRLLKRQGYRVIEASSGAEALACWATHRDEIEILLTDIVMPGHPDGHELSAQLLAEQPNLRVVTMSGYDPTDVAKDGGASRPHVRKPFNADDLFQAIESTRPR